MDQRFFADFKARYTNCINSPKKGKNLKCFHRKYVLKWVFDIVMFHEINCIPIKNWYILMIFSKRSFRKTFWLFIHTTAL